MRKPKYLSPSSLSLWETNYEEYYFKHLAEARPPKTPQKDYMAVGSGFDAFVKSALHNALFGGDGEGECGNFEALFESQVEEQNRDFCLEAGSYIFDCYKISGAYDDLLHDLEKSTTKPQFEFRVDKTVEGVPLMGKPDCCYTHESGARVILDWKVNGFCSKYGSSPYKYYSMVRDGWNKGSKPSRNCNQPHKDYKSMTYQGVEIGQHYLEDTCKDWSDQVAIYGWMLDARIGDENIICIDQIICKQREEDFPLLRIANHRSRVSAAWQNQLVQRLVSCWETIQSGHIFTDMTREDSLARQGVLEMTAKSLSIGGNDIENWVDEIARDNRSFRTR